MGKTFKPNISALVLLIVKILIGKHIFARNSVFRDFQREIARPRNLIRVDKLGYIRELYITGGRFCVFQLLIPPL